MIQVSPFRFTPDDLEGLDAKTRAGLGPLLDTLSVTLQQLVQFAQTQSTEDIITLVLQTDTAVADAFPFVFKHSLSSRPRWVGMVCVPRDPTHSLATPFVMQGFSLTDGGLVSVPLITGLLPQNSYTLTFLVK